MEIHGCKKTIIDLPEKLEPKCVTNQGLPFYSGGIRYKLQLECGSDKIKNQKLKIKNYEGALLKILSNGKVVKRIPWLPNNADLTGFINTDLELEIVLTRKNTFGPLHETNRKPAACAPGNFTTVGTAFSEDYILYPAGLLAPLEIIYK